MNRNRYNRIEYFPNDEEKKEYLYNWLDKLLLKFPMTHPFQIYSYVSEFGLNADEKEKVDSVYNDIIDLMIAKKYIIKYKDSFMMYELTDLGREVKLAGGHYNYTKVKIDWIKVLPIIISIISLLSVIIFGSLNYYKNNKTEKLEIENKQLKEKLINIKK